MREFTLAEARGLLPDVRAHADRIITLRADLADAQVALQRGEQPAVGGVAEVKAVEARLAEAVEWFAATGIQLKGIAPVIVDFPGTVDDRPALLCWLEGETALEWWHPPEIGFVGRRRLDA